MFSPFFVNTTLWEKRIYSFSSAYARKIGAECRELTSPFKIHKC